MSEPHPALVLKSGLFVQYIIISVLFFSETYNAQALAKEGSICNSPRPLNHRLSTEKFFAVFDWRAPNWNVSLAQAGNRLVSP